MRLMTLSLASMLMAGTALAAPIEISGAYRINSVVIEGNNPPDVDVLVGDIANASFLVDDSAFDIDTLLAARNVSEAEFQVALDDFLASTEEVFNPPEDTSLIGTYALPTVVQMSRPDGAGGSVDTFDVQFDQTSVFAGNDFELDPEDFADVELAFGGPIPEFLTDGLDYIEFEANAGLIIDSNTSGFPGEFGNVALVAFSDNGWFERSKASGATPEEMLAEANFVFFGDADQFFGSEQNGFIEAIGTEAAGPVVSDVVITAGELADATISENATAEEVAEAEANALLPTATTSNGFVFTIPEDIIVENETFFIDPIIAVGYTYKIDGADFASVTAPSFAAVADSEYELVVGGMTYTIASGEQVVFADLGLMGVTEFILQGIDPALLLDPADDMAFVTGISITTVTGTLTITQTPNTIFVDDPVNPSAVPLPAAGWLLLAGFGALAGLRRKSRG